VTKLNYMRKFSMCLFVCFASACGASGNVANTTLPSEQNILYASPEMIEESATPSKTFAKLPSDTPTLTMTNTQTVFKTLSKGEYILQFGNEGIVIMSEKGLQEGEIKIQIRNSSASISPDYSEMIFSMDKGYWSEPLIRLELDKEKIYEIPNSEGCAMPTWLPDGKRIIASCDTDKDERKIHLELFVMNINGTNKTQITDCSIIHRSKERTFCNIKNPFVSPNGRWILFDYVDMVSFQPRDSQARLLDSSCLLKPEECKNETSRFITIGDRYEGLHRSWSPDSKYLASVKPLEEGSGSSGIRIYDMEMMVFYEYIETSTSEDDNIGNVSWSPSGNNIAYTMGSGLYIYSIKDRTHKKISDETRSGLLYISVD